MMKFAYTRAIELAAYQGNAGLLFGLLLPYGFMLARIAQQLDPSLMATDGMAITAKARSAFQRAIDINPKQYASMTCSIRSC